MIISLLFIVACDNVTGTNETAFTDTLYVEITDTILVESDTTIALLPPHGDKLISINTHRLAKQVLIYSYYNDSDYDSTVYDYTVFPRTADNYIGTEIIDSYRFTETGVY